MCKSGWKYTRRGQFTKNTQKRGYPRIRASQVKECFRAWLASPMWIPNFWCIIKSKKNTKKKCGLLCASLDLSEIDGRRLVAPAVAVPQVTTTQYGALLDYSVWNIPEEEDDSGLTSDDDDDEGWKCLVAIMWFSCGDWEIVTCSGMHLIIQVVGNIFMHSKSETFQDLFQDWLPG
jgi:hypothetical protein